MAFIRNSWYVAAWSHEVPADGFLARTLLGEPLVFYRGERGQVVALQDRCCHRAAPLSLGRREGDCVRCMYHGLKFGPDGKCVEVPGQERVPAQLRVPSFPVAERDRFVWVWMGEPGLADESQILDFFWQDHPDWRHKPGYMHYQANYQLIIDNLLDFSHLSFLHPTTIGTAQNAEVRPQIERIENGLRITRWYFNDDLPPTHARLATFKAPADRWQIYDWHAPAFLRLDAGSAPAGAGAAEARRAANALQLRHTSVQTPETERTTHYWFCHARNFNLDDEELTESIYGDIVKAFREDQTMIEAQQRVMNALPELPLLPIGADSGLVQARRIIEERLKSERPEPAIAR